MGVGQSLLAKGKGAWMERAEQRVGIFGRRSWAGYLPQRAVAPVWRR